MVIYEVVYAGSEHCTFVTSKRKALKYILAQGDINLLFYRAKNSKYNVYIWKSQKEHWKRFFGSLDFDYCIDCEGQYYNIIKHKVN